MSVTPPLLEARGIGRRGPGDGWLLEGISVAIQAGERWSVAGPSGAGKTLFLRVLALLDPVDGGEILWHGRPVANRDVPGFRRRVIYLHQRPALFAGTVESNLARPHGFHSAVEPWDEDRVTSRLASLGRSADFLTRAVEDLSGGEAQLVAFLRAIQLEPDILLLDEPTAALDSDSAAAIERLVADWFRARAGERASVWVTHAREQAERVGDRVFQLADGRLIR